MRKKNTQPLEVKAEQSIYIYKRSKSGTLMSVHKKKSIPVVYSNHNSKLWPLTHFDYTTKKPISKAIQEVFSNTRLQELSTETFFLTMYLNRDGKIAALAFLLFENTKITAPELEKPESAIKKNASFNLLKEDRDRDGTLAPVQQSVSIKKS